MGVRPVEAEFDLAVLGGGIIGLSCAFEAASRGLRVAVLDPNPVGHKASWAAAGILAGRAGVVGGSPFRDFYLRSLRAYPEWLNKIQSESGLPITHERGGDFQIFPLENPESRRSLAARENQLEREKAAAFTVKDGWPEFLEGKFRRMPVRCFHFPEDGYVNNRELLAALESTLIRRQTVIYAGHRATGLRHHGVNVLSGNDWTLRAEKILIAAGAWSNEILRWIGWEAPLIPVKGQLASFAAFHPEKATIHCQEKLYLIPRGKSLLAGATTEPEIWDEDFTDSGDAFLRDSLQEFFPGLQPEWLETWSGIRPRARDRLPLMGWVDEDRGIALCTGHYKSGITLAPLAGKCMAELLIGLPLSHDLMAFNPRRKRGLQRL